MPQDEAISIAEDSVTWAAVVQAVDQFMAFWGRHQLAPPPEIRLTRHQLDTVREVLPDVKPEDFSHAFSAVPRAAVGSNPEGDA